MNLLRRKLASLLTDAARKGMRALDPDSSCAKALKSKDIDRILDEDIGRICKAVTFREAAKILSLASCLKVVSEEKRKSIRVEIKKVAGEVIDRAEKKYGRLEIPRPCRSLMMRL